MIDQKMKLLQWKGFYIEFEFDARIISEMGP